MDTTKIVINTCFGGFGLSEAASALLTKKKGFEVWERELDRWDADLVSVVEELGEQANGMCAQLEVVEVPRGKRFIIDEYDGVEGLMFADDVEWIVL